MVELKNATVAYGRIHALHGVDLKIPAGQVTAILGANGAGKSSLLKAISGFVDLRAGDVLVEGRSVANHSPHRRAREGVAHVFEGGKAFPELSVRENLEIGGYTAPRGEVEQRIEENFALFPRLQERAAQRAATLSGGEQQMLVLARALMTRPRILLLDEPSLGLAPKVVASAFEKIREINARGVTIVVVEQNARAALEAADSVYVLRNGQVALQGDPASLRSGDALQKAYLA